MSYIDKFYNFSVKADRPITGCDEVLELYRGVCLNDDDVVKIVFGIGQKLGILPNDLSIKDNPNYPPEIRSVLDALHREIPSSSIHMRNDDDVVAYIRSRYAQFGGELDDFVDTVSNDIIDMKRQYEQEQQQLAGEKGGD